MARRLRNWTYRDVTAFLRKNGFSYLKGLKGSHQAWIKPGRDKSQNTVVEVSFTHSSYPMGTLKKMILESGIDLEEWIK
jgi:predicted RNA binding protein YcfA (HicA-like mRNA interferase family)